MSKVCLFLVKKRCLFIATISGSLFVLACHHSSKAMINNNDTLPHRIAVEKIDTTLNFKNMEPTVTKNFETFDFGTYEKRPLADRRGYRNSTYKQYLSNGIVVEMDVAGESEGGGFYYTIYYPNSPFCELRIYYPNGNIKEKGLMYVQGFQKGIWYEFDESGKFLRETDYDRSYRFTFEDVVTFCDKNGININKGYETNETGFDIKRITTITRDSFEGVSHWEIQGTIKDPKSQGFLDVDIKLDGKTGKVLSRTQKPFVIIF